MASPSLRRVKHNAACAPPSLPEPCGTAQALQTVKGTFVVGMRAGRHRDATSKAGGLTLTFRDFPAASFARPAATTPHITLLGHAHTLKKQPDTPQTQEQEQGEEANALAAPRRRLVDVSKRSSSSACGQEPCANEKRPEGALVSAACCQLGAAGGPARTMQHRHRAAELGAKSRPHGAQSSCLRMPAAAAPPSGGLHAWCGAVGAEESGSGSRRCRRRSSGRPAATLQTRRLGLTACSQRDRAAKPACRPLQLLHTCSCRSTQRKTAQY